MSDDDQPPVPRMSPADLFTLNLTRPLTVDEVLDVDWPYGDRTELIDGTLVVTPLLRVAQNDDAGSTQDADEGPDISGMGVVG